MVPSAMSWGFLGQRSRALVWGVVVSTLLGNPVLEGDVTAEVGVRTRGTGETEPHGSIVAVSEEGAEEIGVVGEVRVGGAPGRGEDAHVVCEEEGEDGGRVEDPEAAAEGGGRTDGAEEGAAGEGSTGEARKVGEAEEYLSE